MKTPILFLTAGLALLTSAAFGKTIPNYAEADRVLGQVNFTSALAPDPPTAASLYKPSSVVVDPVTRKVFVADAGNYRVLRYASADALANGASAEAVFGNENLTSAAPSLAAANRISQPSGIFLDSKGRLWVADRDGNRVLMFESASQIGSGAAADRVYGQPDFTTSTIGASATTSAKMNGPHDLCVDSADRLWVADTISNRVLRFDSITTKPSGAAADGVLGQAGFTTFAAGSGASGLQFPTGVTVGGNGALYVTCFNSNRVMRFDNAASLTNGAPATVVLGQPDFTSTSTGFSAAQMNGSAGAWITPDDSLWVADAQNHRVLRFNHASTKLSGAAADGVLGQPDFTSHLPATTGKRMSFPYLKPFVDAEGSLWMAELSNHRVLRFPAPDDVVPDITAPLLTQTGKTPKFTAKKSITIKGRASDLSGIKTVQYKVNKSPLQKATGTTKWSFTAKLKKGKNILAVVATDNNGIPSLRKVIKITRK